MTKKKDKSIVGTIPLEALRLIEGRRILDEFVVAMDAINIDHNFSEVVSQLLECKGKIVTTGMGKAGIVMRKFSSTLCSFGVPSCFLHPGEASHGDLGCISTSDILFVASTSGKTREVLEVIELARHINVKKIVGITSHIDSPIRKKADLTLDMGDIVEAGHLRMAPTTSIMVMLALTDCLALIVAKEKGITMDQYSKYHHSGYLGSKARNDGKIY